MELPSLDFLANKSILVTGGTGSFGSAFIKILLEKSQAARIIVFSRDELKQSVMMNSIPDPEGRLRFFIGDVRDLPRLQRAFKGVQYVVHAAALKQVPLLEYNPFEAIQTNILGTQNVINAAIDQGVERVILISTDKAANPANLYGATKLCAEKLIVNGNFYGTDKGTKFGVVRYGNVLGSRGSIMHVIQDQKKKGEITLTHEEMTRFWITLDRGIALVFHALQTMHGGEIFIPKIPSMRVADLIAALAPNVPLKKIGIRPGEKLHEVLVTPEEARHAKEFEQYYVILPEHVWWGGVGNYHDGTSPTDGWSYSSHTNTNWLDHAALLKLAEELLSK